MWISFQTSLCKVSLDVSSSAVFLDLIFVDKTCVCYSNIKLFQILNLQNEPLWNDWQDLKTACTDDPQTIMNIILKAKVRHCHVDTLNFEWINLLNQLFKAAVNRQQYLERKDSFTQFCATETNTIMCLMSRLTCN